MMWLVDFVGYSFLTAPPARTAVQTVHILQNHYPERLGVCICYLPPRVFSYTWKVRSASPDSATAFVWSAVYVQECAILHIA